ncbi:hypothetical protein ACIBJI_23980 [Nocardia sp. NPDC050408]|uniref:hypothetical protein n=1 Tax=Nocardia sp. NPDC050408 TaxID=3364319 RepID=UPI00379DD7B9
MFDVTFLAWVFISFPITWPFSRFFRMAHDKRGTREDSRIGCTGPATVVILRVPAAAGLPKARNA